MTPFGFSKNLCYSPYLHLSSSTSLPQLQDSVKQSLRSKHSVSLRSPRSDGQAQCVAARRQAPWRFTARRLGWGEFGEVCVRSVPGGKLFHHTDAWAHGSVTLEPLPGPPDCNSWSTSWRAYCVLLLSLRTPQGELSSGVRRVGSCNLNRTSVSSPTFAARASKGLLTTHRKFILPQVKDSGIFIIHQLAAGLPERLCLVQRQCHPARPCLHPAPCCGARFSSSLVCRCSSPRSSTSGSPKHRHSAGQPFGHVSANLSWSKGTYGQHIAWIGTAITGSPTPQFQCGANRNPSA